MIVSFDPFTRKMSPNIEMNCLPKKYCVFVLFLVGTLF